MTRTMLTAAATLCAFYREPRAPRPRPPLLSPPATRRAPGAGAPRSNPSVLRSSSRSGQWMPKPPPATRQFFRWAAVALNRRGYQASGTVMVRPSRKPTLMVSFRNFTSTTRSSAASAKMPMPSLQQFGPMFNHQFLNPPQLLRGETEVSCQSHRLQPELRRQVVPIDMDVWRLV